MPFYDRSCTACEWSALDLLEPMHTQLACPTCGEETVRVWTSKKSQVIGDECDIWQENGFSTPTHFTSKKALETALHAKGLQQMVRHVTVPGTDKSPVTTDWSRGMDPQTMANAAALVARAGLTRTADPPREPDVPVTWTITEKDR